MARKRLSVEEYALQVACLDECARLGAEIHLCLARREELFSAARDAALAARAAGATITEIAEIVGVSRPTLYEWLPR